MTDRLNVIIPVHNGANVIADTIKALGNNCPERLNVTVVVNGSTDKSTREAKSALQELKVLGASTTFACIDAASREAALNLGEQHADHSAHYLYLDQDARIGAGSIPRIIDVLDGAVHFVAGRAAWRTSSKLVGRAMEAWNSLPYVLNAPVTAGMYCVSNQGRRRWMKWPAGLPDDKYARLHFTGSERRRLESVEYSVMAPPDFKSLVAARARYDSYNRRLRAIAPALTLTDSGRGLYNCTAITPALLPGMAVLAVAELLGRVQGRL